MHAATLALPAVLAAWTACSCSALPAAPNGAASSHANASAMRMLPRTNRSAPESWELLRQAIDDFALVANVAVSVGDARGELFRHSKGTTSFDTQMSIASATKWVSGVTIMACVEAGFLGLDDFAYEHLPYWDRDPANPRSRVTLRHLLSFVSGMSGSTSCPAELDFRLCVQDMYGRSSATLEPGSAVVYNEVHLMYAGAMAEAAAGIPMAALFERFIFTPLDMTNTRWNNANGRPLLGSGLTTTPEDYGRFLNAYFQGQIVSPATRADMERSHYPDAELTGLVLLQGRYGLANWFQCIPAIPFTEACQADDRHNSVGASGYYPLTDRRLEYWMNIGNSGATAAGTSAMQLLLRPAVDEAVLASRL